jgi:hypothetical protein
MKFKKLRYRILFSFLIIAGISILLIISNFIYIQKKSNITFVQLTLNQVNTNILNKYTLVGEFLTNESNNPAFFISETNSQEKI